MASDDQSILHLVNPIAGLGDLRIMRYQEQRFLLFSHNPLQQLEGAPRIRAVEISGGFIGENHTRIIGERPRHGHPLLLAAGKMPARPFQFAAETDGLEQMRGTLVHLRLAQLGQAAHGDHDVFLGGEIFEEKMELEDESEKLIPFSGQGVIDEVGHRFVFDRDRAAIGVIEQSEDVKQSALAAAGGTDDRVDGAALELERDPAQRMHARILFA